jgi:uncharacterized membrane protein (DUF4010 family)
MAVVILPLLPDGPFGPLGGVRPRELWALVLFFAGLSFAGYTARRAMGPQQGWAVAGLLGGIVSSTAVALGFSRTSRTDPALGPSLAAGVVGASTVMLPRMLLAAGVLHPPLGMALLPFLGPPLVVGIAASLLLLRRRASGEAPDTPTNPLQLGAALQMVVLFQIVLFIVRAVRDRFGAAGLVTTGAVLGLTDVDALTVSMVQNAATGVPLEVAARAMTAGALANTCLKLGLVAGIGRGRFRPLAAAALAALALATAATLALA